MADRLHAFLYLLGRDHLPLGTLNGIKKDMVGGEQLEEFIPDFKLSDPNLAAWAMDLRRVLLDIEDDTIQVPCPACEHLVKFHDSEEMNERCGNCNTLLSADFTQCHTVIEVAGDAPEVCKHVEVTYP